MKIFMLLQIEITPDEGWTILDGPGGFPAGFVRGQNEDHEWFSLDPINIKDHLTIEADQESDPPFTVTGVKSTGVINA
jgi:hypothetical protein